MYKQGVLVAEQEIKRNRESRNAIDRRKEAAKVPRHHQQYCIYRKKLPQT
jgi:hypothetical protein